ncbi:hypothetical protein [Xanthomonas theicola]|uniref:Protein sip-5 n=1 Tax=Xanthomonas theicola TaxID=56464 RepID=A0A2S6ZAS8_9XANT|nr:hypothetical protein [Xanthomonas theicola]PPT80395.1 hypothetical protein XthCFBP4691_18210 [Xanthomonas theicola]QNH26349.1 hypothetical protein G4Q83_18700 [Xanthomonas theicola]
MKFHQLQHRIARAETVLDGRQQRMQAQWTTLQRVWREGWTPLRIVVVGLGAGFLAGRAEPAAAIGKLGGARWLQMLSALSSLVTATKAKQTSDHAERAAETTQETAAVVDPAAVAAVRCQAATGHAVSAAPADQVPPRAAEAATELSER